MYKAPFTALAALLAAGALAAPGSAAADGPGTFCVHVSPCPPGAIDKGDDLEAALKAASGSVSTGNVILLGDKGSPYVGPFDLGLKVEAAVPGDPRQSAAGDFLLGTVKATGPGRPTLTAPPGKTVFKGGAAKLDGVDVRLPDSGATTGIELSNGDLHDVTVSGPASPPPASVGLKASGAVDIDGLRLKNAGARALTGGQATAITARGLRVDTDEGGLDTFGADVRLTESRINTGGLGRLLDRQPVRRPQCHYVDGCFERHLVHRRWPLPRSRDDRSPRPAERRGRRDRNHLGRRAPDAGQHPHHCAGRLRPRVPPRAPDGRDADRRQGQRVGPHPRRPGRPRGRVVHGGERRARGAAAGRPDGRRSAPARRVAGDRSGHAHRWALPRPRRGARGGRRRQRQRGGRRRRARVPPRRAADRFRCGSGLRDRRPRRSTSP